MNTAFVCSCAPTKEAHDQHEGRGGMRLLQSGVRREALTVASHFRATSSTARHAGAARAPEPALITRQQIFGNARIRTCDAACLSHGWWHRHLNIGA